MHLSVEKMVLNDEFEKKMVSIIGMIFRNFEFNFAILRKLRGQKNLNFVFWVSF